jgi:signal transduction histidine kinase
MAVELAEIAAGLPMAASFALAGGISSLRAGRRRTALNEAMHELRRPLQALSLALPTDPKGQDAVDSSLRLAAAALDRLDREINGDIAELEVDLVPFMSLLEEAVGRWSPRAVAAGGGVRLRWVSDEQWVKGSGIELTQAVDNLINNAIEHGGGEVTIEGRREGIWLLVSVRDRGGKGSHARHSLRRSRHGSRSRHGHGLRVVARVVRTHGGSFSLRPAQSGIEARLRLPLYLPQEVLL